MSELERVMQMLRDTKHEVSETEPGVYTHVFTPPEMTMEDVMRLLSRPPNPKLEIIVRKHSPSLFERLLSFIKNMRAKR